MMASRFSSYALLVLAVSVIPIGACSSGSSSSTNDFSQSPLMTLTSDSGKLHVAVRTSPTQPPTRGEQSVQLVITDDDDKPQSGLSLDTTPWMPAMGHGASVTPSVTETSPGTYVVEDVDLFMPGTWELRTTIADADSSSTADHVAPSFQIP